MGKNGKSSGANSRARYPPARAAQCGCAFLRDLWAKNFAVQMMFFLKETMVFLHIFHQFTFFYHEIWYF